MSSALKNGSMRSGIMNTAKYSQQIRGPDLTSSITATQGTLKNGWSLWRPNARTTPIPNPRTPPAVAMIRLTNRPPHWDASIPSPASLSSVEGT